MEITKTLFGSLPNKEEIYNYHLSNSYIKVDIINYGAIIRKIETLDYQNKWGNIILGFDNLSSYLERSRRFGAICGRHAGRIPEGKISIDNQIIEVPCDKPGFNMHGGPIGLDKRVWNVKVIEDGITLHYFSPDKENQFPGNVHFYVTYRLVEKNLSMDFIAYTDTKTPINLNNHSYFNLSGGQSQNIEEHLLRIDADYFVSLSEKQFNEAITPTENTPFNFKTPKPIGQDISKDDIQLQRGGGYDHPFILTSPNYWQIELQEPESRRRLRIHSDQKAVVLYTGNSLGNEGELNNGLTSTPRVGVCLETQDIPNGFQFPNWQTPLAEPNNPYRSHTVWHFDTI